MRILEQARTEFATQGYTLLDDVALGWRAAREDFHRRYFRPEVLASDLPEVHANRARAWVRLVLARDDAAGRVVDVLPDARVENSNHSGARAYRYLPEVGREAGVQRLALALAEILPRPLQSRRQKVDIHLFRTGCGPVVNTRHHDDVDATVIYVLRRSGDGAVTELTHGLDGSGLVVRRALAEGEVFAFCDRPFAHYTSELTSPDGSGSRDVLIVTFDRLPYRDA